MRTDLKDKFVGSLRKRVGLALFGLVLGLSLSVGAGEDEVKAEAGSQAGVVRIGIAPGTWAGVNRGDAAAAIAAWAKIIMNQRGTMLEVETRLFERDEEMTVALRNQSIDAVSMLTHQWVALEEQLRPETVFLASHGKQLTERYVLLVHRASGINDLSQLRGRRLLLQHNARTSLAPHWLEILLARRSLAASQDFFKTTTQNPNPGKVVLQVFFRQAEVGLVTTNVFALAGELNPQIHKELQVLEVSPEVVPALFFFNPGHASKAREELEPAILTLHESPAGLQVLTVFQCEQMVKSPISCFEGTRQLLAEYEQLSRRNGAAKKQAAVLSQSGPGTTLTPPASQ